MPPITGRLHGARPSAVKRVLSRFIFRRARARGCTNKRHANEISRRSRYHCPEVCIFPFLTLSLCLSRAGALARLRRARIIPAPRRRARKTREHKGPSRSKVYSSRRGPRKKDRAGAGLYISARHPTRSRICRPRAGEEDLERTRR